ncbi:MAG: hypothetical protein FJZ01_05605 [Candidatus Sericytochromatia bacterium]|nr:hypothetical protein [Candidatus Tanganyikabacteria bacterium]
MSANHERHLRLKLRCGCTSALVRREPDEKFVAGPFDRDPGCRLHESPPGAGTPVTGFGPYPEWSANLALRVASLPEAGGLMEREHAFVLDEQFVFFGEGADPRPLGPIADARWN